MGKQPNFAQHFKNSPPPAKYEAEHGKTLYPKAESDYNI